MKLLLMQSPATSSLLVTNISGAFMRIENLTFWRQTFSLGLIVYTRCSHEVPGMILLQSYLFTYSLLRGVTFKVLPMSSYALVTQ
jgi:hypothetical protein